MTARSATVRRAILTSLPVGSRITAEVADGTLRLRTASGTNAVALSAYRAVLVRPSVVLLHLKGSQIFTALPRELLQPDDIARLRAGIEAPVPAS